MYLYRLISVALQLSRSFNSHTAKAYKKRDQVTGNTDTMRSMTTAAIVLCPGLPLSGLRQSMHDPTIPLRLKDILAAPSISGEDSGIGLNITRSLISDTIKRFYTASVDFVFRDSNHYPKMLNIYYLNIN